MREKLRERERERERERAREKGRERGGGGGGEGGYFTLEAKVPAQLLHRNMQRFRGRLVLKAHGLCVSFKTRLESEKEEEEETQRHQNSEMD